MKSLICKINEAKHSFRIFSEAKYSFRIKSHLKKQDNYIVVLAYMDEYDDIIRNKSTYSYFKHITPDAAAEVFIVSEKDYDSIIKLDKDKGNLYIFDVSNKYTDIEEFEDDYCDGTLSQRMLNKYLIYPEYK